MIQDMNNYWMLKKIGEKMYTDGIIFDMDGTIWDTCQEVADCWSIVAAKYDQNIKFTVDMIKSCMGLTAEAFACKLMPQVEDEIRTKILKESVIFENIYIKDHGTMVYPQVLETLAKLSQKYPLFIVSNCQHGYIETFLEMYDAGKYIKGFENPERTGVAKAGNIQIICDRYGLKAPVYIGDTQGDLDACKAAGVPFVFAAYGFGNAQTNDCAAQIESFAQLMDLF